MPLVEKIREGGETQRGRVRIQNVIEVSWGCIHSLFLTVFSREYGLFIRRILLSARGSEKGSRFLFFSPRFAVEISERLSRKGGVCVRAAGKRRKSPLKRKRRFSLFPAKALSLKCGSEIRRDRCTLRELGISPEGSLKRIAPRTRKKNRS